MMKKDTRKQNRLTRTTSFTAFKAQVFWKDKVIQALCCKRVWSISWANDTFRPTKGFGEAMPYALFAACKGTRDPQRVTLSLKTCHAPMSNRNSPGTHTHTHTHAWHCVWHCKNSLEPKKNTSQFDHSADPPALHHTCGHGPLECLVRWGGAGLLGDSPSNPESKIRLARVQKKNKPTWMNKVRWLSKRNLQKHRGVSHNYMIRTPAGSHPFWRRPC